MGKFDFYDIELLVERGVSNDLLREIVADANRFRVVQNGELSKALEGSVLPLLTPNRPSDWNGQIDSFINAHFNFEGAFNVGDSVIDHYAHPLADDWYKQLTGLEAKICRRVIKFVTIDKLSY